ncbi:DUF4259 domain-containing protein [Ideonella sp. BN130291]|uniref:DUF4259 domain-containing protein n=1 Tax=Ideonella sp. BN130291 TaxID=3112940 RepID=UPI002E26C952|nr:DUF4259 domain-containing protein [Ideonella sp. BN130291]
MQMRRRVLSGISMPLVLPSVSRAGAWSHESFENNSALDWVAEFQGAPTGQFLRRTLALGTSSEYIESFVGESVVAAAEVVAASLGRPCKGFPEELRAIVAESGAQFRPLASFARLALTGVLGPKSELRQNWSVHAEKLSRWEGSVNELLKRLSPPVA